MTHTSCTVMSNEVMLVVTMRRVDELLLELRLARRREAEETASLTEMVQNVEANLRMTTVYILTCQ